MKIGSLIQRLPHEKGCWKFDLTQSPSPGPKREVPIGEPVVLLDWRYAQKWDKDMFELAIEGYFQERNDAGDINQYWYPASQFVELQAPMDLSFIEQMQVSETKVLQLTDK